ncbi:MAG: DedA family protein [Bacteroidales bacterium]|nr:DedA family protein [Bacteroidales bacterium]
MRHIRPILFLLLLSFSLNAVVAAPAESVNIAETLRSDDSASTGFVATALRWYDAHMNYGAVGLLMTVESSFIPFPSEVVIPPAVYVASNPDSAGGMNVWIILLVGTLGALLGAFINYFLSRWLGRPIIYAFVNSKVGHLLSLSREKMERAEEYFNQRGNISTLVGRLIPVIRQLISIPAGLSKMNIGAFALFTFLGAAIWNVVLTLLGILAYRAAKPDLIEQYSHHLSIAIIAIFCLAVVIFTVRLLWKRKKKNSTTGTAM